MAARPSGPALAVLELFPTAVLDTSILTSVMVGLLVVWFLQEWLGWGFTGLVVPGYLASVLAIQPETALVMVIEAVGTWLVMVALSDAVPRWWPWNPLFGRDRFFLALLASVGVRLGTEAALLPLLAQRFDLRIAAELHSMGLVVVPLLAYAIWRNGPVAAVPRLGLPLVLTWLILELVLLGRTNLSLSSFELTYEDLARDFVSSPRAYMLLLTGAWLGSVTNLRYGWDFGGIIVPGLLALCWLQPERLAATVGEAVLIAVALQLLLKNQRLSRLNLTGGRLLVLGMIIGYLLKFGLGHLLGAGWPGLRLRQLFGFGYLLPTLMALRIVRSGDPFRTLMPSMLTSLGGFLGGTALAYVLALAMPPPAPPALPGDSLSGPTAEAALRAAWGNEGPIPVDLGGLVDRGSPVLVSGGEGFGALWLRGSGRPLLVSTRAGPLGQAEAALTLARELDAQGVLLCAPDGAACGEARRRLGLRLPVLVLVEGSTSLLRTTGRLVEAMPPGDPGRATLESLLGPLPLVPSEGESQLVLSPKARLQLASRWMGQVPAPWRHPGEAPMSAQEAPESGTLALLHHSLALPLVAWARDEDPTGDALALATGTARMLGAELSSDGERVSVIGPDWRLLVRKGGGPSVVQVPLADETPGLMAWSLHLAEDLEATAWLMDMPPSWHNEVHDSRRPAHHVLLGLLEALGPEAEVVSVDGLRDLQDPGAEVVLSLGHSLSPGLALPGLARTVSERLEGVGVPVGWYDGAPERLSLGDGSHPGRAAAQAATRRDAHLSLFVSSPLRAGAQPLELGHPLHDVLTQPLLPVWQSSVDRLLEAGQTPSPAWADWRQAVADLRIATSLKERSRVEAQARRQGARLGLVCDPSLGCLWLAALRCQDGRCTGALAPVSPPGARGGTQGGGVQGGSLRDRLLLGDGSIDVQGLPAPELLPVERATP